jgi:hypothetical protein
MLSLGFADPSMWAFLIIWAANAIELCFFLILLLENYVLTMTELLSHSIVEVGLNLMPIVHSLYLISNNASL